MKQLKVKSIVVLAALFSSVLFSSLAFAKAYQQPPGEPPRGLKVEGAAGGTKLYGTITIEEFNVDESDNFYNAKIVLRVRMGNDIQIFYGEISNTLMNGSNPAFVQDLITQKMAPQIISYFFCNPSLSSCNLHVTLKNISEFVFVDAGGTVNTSSSRFVMADVELAVK